jgi:hypothetical protein
VGIDPPAEIDPPTHTPKSKSTRLRIPRRGGA